MSLSLTSYYQLSEYQKDLQVAINSALATITAASTSLTTVVSAAVTALSSNITAVSAAVTVLSAAVTVLSASVTALSSNITAVSGNITTQFDITSATITNTYTLDISSIRNFNLLNADTAGKTLMITGTPTAASTFVELKIKLTFSTTATITYTGTITWSANAAPNPTAAGTFFISLKSVDAGVNWYGNFSGLY
jgi:hypothetical protein